MVADYLRAGAGLALTAGPLLFAELLPLVALVLGILAALFAAYGVRTALRQNTAVELSEEGIRTTGPFGTGIAWSDLHDVQLRYFSTRRDRGQGWMQLKLKGAGRTIRIDSSLQGFDEVTEWVARAARQRQLPVSAPTAANLAAMGIAPAGHRS